MTPPTQAATAVLPFPTPPATSHPPPSTPPSDLLLPSPLSLADASNPQLFLLAAGTLARACGHWAGGAARDSRRRIRQRQVQQVIESGNGMAHPAVAAGGDERGSDERRCASASSTSKDAGAGFVPPPASTPKARMTTTPKMTRPELENDHYDTLHKGPCFPPPLPFAWSDMKDERVRIKDAGGKVIRCNGYRVSEILVKCGSVIELSMKEKDTSTSPSNKDCGKGDGSVSRQV